MLLLRAKSSVLFETREKGFFHDRKWGFFSSPDFKLSGGLIEKHFCSWDDRAVFSCCFLEESCFNGMVD